MNIIECNQLHKTVSTLKGFRFSNKSILSDININIKQGDIVGILGENGSGKSTLLNILSGLSEFDGTLKFNDTAINAFDTNLRKQQSSILDIGSLPKQLTTLQLIHIYRDLYPQFDFEKTCSELQRLSIKLEDVISSLSKGNQAKVYLNLVIHTNQPIMIFDEPTLGLDVPSRKYIYQKLLDLNINKNTTIILACHEIDEIAFLLNQVIVLKQGKVSLNDAMDTLQDQYIEIDASKNDQALFESVTRLNERVSLQGTTFMVDKHQHPDLTPLPQHVTTRRPKLSDIVNLHCTEIGEAL